MVSGDSSAGALLDSIVSGLSSAGRGRGSGSDDVARRWLLPVPLRWRNQVIKSCAIPDRGGGASRRGGDGSGGACALTGGAANNRNDRENVPALDTLDLTVIPSSAGRDRWQLGAIGLAEIRAVLGRRGAGIAVL
jgi:hypothetical protein